MGNRLFFRHIGECVSIFRRGDNGEELQVCTILPDELPYLIGVLADVASGDAAAFNPGAPVKPEEPRLVTVDGAEPGALFSAESLRRLFCRFRAGG